MAHLSKSRRALTGTCLTLLLGLLVGAWGVSPAASLGLPSLSVEVPAVSVKTPAVTVTTPSVSVKTPTGTTPAPAKTPAGPVKTPPVLPKTPTVPVKTTPAKTPAVKVNAPSVSVPAPTVSVPAPSTPSLGKVTAPAAGATTTSGPVAGKLAGTKAGSSPDAATTTGASSPAPGGQEGQATPPTAASEYGAGPTVDSLMGETGARRSPGARARIAADRTLAETVARLQGCLSELPESHRRALMLRSGVGSPHVLGPRATAARLHLGAARFARVERQALAELREAARTRSCGQMSGIVAAVVAFLAPGGGDGSAGTGGVEAARYSFSPPSRHEITQAGSSRGSLLGDISPMASGGIVVLLLVLVAAVAAGIVVTHGSGNSPPWRRWRRRVADGLRRAR
jgi:hypothetical protein